MKKTDVVTVGRAFARLGTVAPLARFCISVTWTTGEQAIVDLAPTILTFKTYAPLREDRALFETVHVANASVIAWGKDEAIDMHVSEIECLAETVMDATNFQAFLKDMGLTWDAAAAQLGMSRRIVGYYAKGRQIPRYVALACAQLRMLQEAATSGTDTSPGLGNVERGARPFVRKRSTRFKSLS